MGGAAKAAPAAAVYQRLCVSCHGVDGRGNADKAKSLKIEPTLLDFARPEAVKMTRDQLKTVLLKGKDKMPGYERKLKAGEVDPLLDYVVQLRDKAKDK